MTSPGLHKPVPGGAAGRRHHLAAVADDFLPMRAAGPARVRPVAPAVYAAAPGRCDTAAILAGLHAAGADPARHDLGGTVGQRLERWELEGQSGLFEPQGAVLLWCPVDQEGPSVESALALGRLGALLQPSRITLLWLAAGPAAPGRLPSGRLQQRVRDLARAAVPGAEVRLHCLGWRRARGAELEDLARRFA